MGSLSTGLSFCCQQKGRCLRPGRACPSSLSRQERDGKLELIRLKTIPAVGTKQGKRKPKQSERTAGGRGVPARSPPSPGAFFRAACAKSEATPSVTDRDVNPSAPEPCCSAGAPPSSPKKNPQFGCSGWLEQEDGRGSLLGACWQTSGAAPGARESCRGGRRDMGRKEGATVTTGGSVWPVFLKFPWPMGAPRQRGRRRGGQPG